MKFFFDESGSFTVPSDPQTLCASVVAGVVLSELVESDFCRDYASFVSSLAPEETDRGEPKGRLITSENRTKFCQLLNKYARRGLLLAPALVDMSLVSLSKSFFSIRAFSGHVRHLAADAARTEDRVEVTALADKVQRLSEVQGWRLHTWAIAFQLAMKSAISWLCSEGNEHCWEAVRFEIDPVDARKDGLEQSLFLRLIHTWLGAYSRQHPFEIHDDIHGPEHPFVKRYLKDDGLDLERMLDGNVYFCDSKASMGIQLADIAANIIFRAAHSPSNESGALETYACLMDCCPYPPGRGPGISYVSSDIRLAPMMYQKYRHLTQVLELRRGEA